MIQLDNAVERYNKLILNELHEANINCWLAGGAIRDYFAGVPVNTDYDLFFPNDIEYQKAAKYFKEKECIVKWESDNGMKIIYNKITIDLIKKFFSTPQETIEAFDFTVAMFAVDTEKVYYGESTFIDLAKRQLMINKIPYPASTMSRAFRYYKKGYIMCLGEMKKLIEAIQDMPKVLIEPTGEMIEEAFEQTVSRMVMADRAFNEKLFVEQLVNKRKEELEKINNYRLINIQVLEVIELAQMSMNPKILIRFRGEKEQSRAVEDDRLSADGMNGFFTGID